MSDISQTFLDRDGTINDDPDPGYTYRIADYALLPGVAEGLERLGKRPFSSCIPRFGCKLPRPSAENTQ